ncbi:hypothetical protein [Bradyrhizobium oligotrophicum]|uniref:hypothetical protein n=1 Tax=Bradyrhizobium oligotrophicum TaxID=44255 RepID=UPI0005A6F98E|nr:hypothetical protein [Bradyrhizobium oligotrophicum]
MTKPLRSLALAAFAAATAGRNMTRVASIAVALGIGAMVLSMRLQIAGSLPCYGDALPVSSPNGACGFSGRR